MIISYEQFVRNIEDLKEVNFDLIVCDEGHRLKNSGVQAANVNITFELKLMRKCLIINLPLLQF